MADSECSAVMSDFRHIQQPKVKSNGILRSLGIAMSLLMGFGESTTTLFL